MKANVESFYLESEVRVANSGSAALHHESNILPECGEDDSCSDGEVSDS